MTEAQLERILNRGLTRMRVNAALRWTCAAAAAGLGIGAALVVGARVWPAHAHTELVVGVCWSLVLLVVALAVLGFRVSRPALGFLTLRLDRSAGLSEHLTTWEDFRQRPEASAALTRSFVQAQRQATLRLTEGLELSRHLPIRIPEWSRGLWLGVLVLGCALLMPEQSAGSPAHERAEARKEMTALDGAASRSMRPLAPGEEPAAFKVQIVPQTKLFEWQLQVMDPRTTPEMKARILEELEAKRGAIPVSELSDEVRDLLTELRRQAAKANPDAKLTEGSQVHEGRAGETPRKPGPVFTGAADPVGSPEELVGLARDRFPDLAVPLEKYYRAVSVSGP